MIKDEEDRELVDDVYILERCSVCYQKLVLFEGNPNEGRNEQQSELEDAITEITGAEMEMALRNSKNGKATGLDNLSVEVWKSLRSTGVNFLNEALNTIRSLTRRKSHCRYTAKKHLDTHLQE